MGGRAELDSNWGGGTARGLSGGTGRGTAIAVTAASRHGIGTGIAAGSLRIGAGNVGGRSGVKRACHS